ncbi:MAG: hypothetical protein ACKO5F_05080 [Synechococcus sp.]
MPLFLLRDGSVLRCSSPPDGLQCDRYVDRRQREIFVLLYSASECVLLAAQPKRSSHSRARNRQGRKADVPLAA